MLLPDHEIRRLCVPKLWSKFLQKYDGGFYPPQLHYSQISWETLSNTKIPMIEPFSEAVSGDGVIGWGLSSAGYDLRLGPEILVFKNTSGEPINPKLFNDLEYRNRMFDVFSDLPDGRAFVIPPGGYILGHSLETLRIPRWLKGRVEGKSTMARGGITINVTPEEPAWEGHLTIEVANDAPAPSLVFVGEGICQLEFHLLSSEPEVDYAQKKGKYQNQVGVTPARVL